MFLCRNLDAVSPEHPKLYQRRLNPDEQIKAALRDGLSEKKSQINSNPICKGLDLSNGRQYARPHNRTLEGVRH